MWQTSITYAKELGAKFDGNADLGYRGSDIKTPNIDKLP